MRTLCILSMLVTMILATNASAQVGSYSQDFEGLTQSDPAALGDDGWLVFGAVFDELGLKFDYGTFPAPNEQPGVAFSSIASGQGGAAQGTQYMNVFSDYNCCGLDGTDPEGHGNGTDIVRSTVLQGRTVDASDFGRTVEFSFDAKLPGGDDAQFALAPPATAEVFIRTINPDTFFTSAEVILDVSTLFNNATWDSQTLAFDITSAFDGHLFQFGFTNVSSNFEPTGIYYDNIKLRDAPAGDGDFDEDGDVDGADFLVWQRDIRTGPELSGWEDAYGTVLSLAAVGAVPEPASSALLLLGIVCLNGTSRRGR